MRFGEMEFQGLFRAIHGCGGRLRAARMNPSLLLVGHVGEDGQNHSQPLCAFAFGKIRARLVGPVPAAWTAPTAGIGIGRFQVRAHDPAAVAMPASSMSCITSR